MVEIESSARLLQTFAGLTLFVSGCAITSIIIFLIPVSQDFSANGPASLSLFRARGLNLPV